MFISLIIPTNHSEDFIEETISEIERYVSSSEHSFEVVVVDDGSLDGTFDKLSEISGKTKLNFRIIQLYTNRGQFQALMAGFANAGGEYVVTLDDDLEYHPGQIDLLIDTFVKEPGRYDVVIGVPKDVKKSLLRSAGSFVKNEVNTIQYQNDSNYYHQINKIHLLW